MSAYAVALFIHILGVVTLFAAIGVMQLGGIRVRRARSSEQALMWLELLGIAGRMFAVAFVLILAAGLYMTVDVWTFSTPWIGVALFSVGIMIVVGTVVVGRGVGKMAAVTAAAADGPLSADVLRSIDDRVVWTSLSFLNGMAVGVLWLMTNKPGWTESILVVVVLGLVAGAIGARTAGRASS